MVGSRSLRDRVAIPQKPYHQNHNLKAPELVVNDAILVSCSLRYENVFGFGKVFREFAVNV